MEMEDIIKKITEEVYKNLSAMQGGMQAAPSMGGACAAGSYELVKMDPHATVGDLEQACAAVRSKGYTALCVPQWFVNLAAEKLHGSAKVDTIISLPGGTTSTYAKYAEVNEAVKNGANEITIPVNMDLVKESRLSDARNDLETAMITAASTDGVCVRALLEAGIACTDALKEAVEMICDCGIKHIVLSFVMSNAKADSGVIAEVIAACAGKADVAVLGGGITALPQGATRVMSSYVT